MGATYGPHEIEVLEGLEPIRRRPGMYLGDPHDPRTTTACVAESIRALVHAGASRVDVTIEDHVAFELVGEGATMAAGTLAAVLGSPLCGCRCQWERAGLLEECNPAVTNALCEWFEVEVGTGSEHRRASWREGREHEAEALVGHDARRILRIRARLDRTIFGPDASIAWADLDATIAGTAVLAAGVRLCARDRRTGQEVEHHAPRGLRDRLVAHGVDDALVVEGAGEDGTRVHAALGWSGDGPAHVDGWVTSVSGDERRHAVDTLLATVADVVVARAGWDQRGPGIRLHENALRGFAAAVAIVPASDPDVRAIVHRAVWRALPGYLLERPALLASLGRNTGRTVDELAAGLRARDSDISE